MIQIGVNVIVDNKGKVDSLVYIGPTTSWVMGGGPRSDEEKIPLEIHRQASKLYDRTLDFAEQIKK